MEWWLKSGDVLVEPADVLICSANPWLNLSGGVGGEILRRGGEAMQRFLHDQLTRRQVKALPRGSIVESPPFGLAFNSVLHAVAIDAFYQSEPDAIGQILAECLSIAASVQARFVAITALATGYGRLPMEQFAAGVGPLLARSFGSVERATICVRGIEQRDLLAKCLPQALVA